MRDQVKCGLCGKGEGQGCECGAAALKGGDALLGIPQEQTKLHLTHTGFDAGIPFCTVNKAEAIERGERFGHVPYSNLDKFFKLPFLCADCKAAWDRAGEGE